MVWGKQAQCSSLLTRLTQPPGYSISCKTRLSNWYTRHHGDRKSIKHKQKDSAYGQIHFHLHYFVINRTTHTHRSSESLQLHCQWMHHSRWPVPSEKAMTGWQKLLCLFSSNCANICRHKNVGHKLTLKRLQVRWWEHFSRHGPAWIRVYRYRITH